MPYRILMVSSEATPFAKSGGLAEVVSSLSRSLAEMGHDVRIVLPRYYAVDLEGLENLQTPLAVPIGLGEEWVGVFRAQLPGSSVPVYFLDHQGLFGRAGLYAPPGGSDFPDNARRFTLLDRGAFQLAKMLNWYPDIFHAHDWQAGLVPLYLQTWESREPFNRAASVFTIHNIGYQGHFPAEDLNNIQISSSDASRLGLATGSGINFLHAGLQSSDLITTVSPRYSEEIKSPSMGFGMDGILRRRSQDLFGILNGIDYDDWNPETDEYLPAHYSEEDLSGKVDVKRALQKEFGLPVDPSVPLFGMISRLADQKGFGELCGPAYGSLYSICRDHNLQFIILGTGEQWCEQELRNLDASLPNLRAAITFNNRLSHLIEGGSDFFLMPSRYEPCGLNQMYSLRYGTLPIVRRTGGLADTVEQFDQASGEGTGFLFDDLNPKSLYDVVGWAVWAFYNHPEHIRNMRRRAMSRRFNWERAAERYAELYTWALDRREGRFFRSW